MYDLQSLLEISAELECMHYYVLLFRIHLGSLLLLLLFVIYFYYLQFYFVPH